jgi:hypothetical protein
MHNNQTPAFLNDLDIHTKYQQSRNLRSTSSMYKNQQKFTIKSNKNHDADFLRSWEKDGITKIFKPADMFNIKTSKHLLKYSKQKGRDAYMYINLPADQYCQRSIKYLLTKSSTSRREQSNSSLST